jgi:hypothetical protein
MTMPASAQVTHSSIAATPLLEMDRSFMTLSAGIDTTLRTG